MRLQAVFVLVTLAASRGLLAQSDPSRLREREILRELIEVNSSDSAGNTGLLAAKMADRLKAAGFPASDITILGYDPKFQSLVARYREHLV